jgi:hypothetical protein
MQPRSTDSAILPPSPSRHPGRAGFGTLLRNHWLVRLGAEAMVLGISPLLIYLAWERVTGLEGQNHEGFGILALIGANLGVLLVLAGAVAVGVRQLRSRPASR